MMALPPRWVCLTVGVMYILAGLIRLFHMVWPDIVFHVG